MNRVSFILFLVSVLLMGCTEKNVSNIEPQTIKEVTALAIPDNIVKKSELFYDYKKSLWMFNNKLYSGYAVRYYESGILKEKMGILAGKKQNQAMQWYPDGNYKQVANYHLGKLHGEKKQWSSEAGGNILITHLNYNAGKPHGEQKKWYPTGELFKKLHLNMGKEEGIQQAFRKNGALYANYEAKEGRIYGLKKATLCFGLGDESIQYEK